MNTYEALVIFPSQGVIDVLQEGKNPFEETVKKCEGKILNRTDLGKRPLGYKVKKANEGHFTSFTFELPPAKVDALKGLLNLIEDILKYTIVKVVKKSKAELFRQAKLSPAQTVQAAQKR